VTTPDASQGSAQVYVSNGTATSAGNGPGYATLPWDEANGLVDAGLAVWGDTPPMGMGQGPRPVTPP
jgi:hypothetical protein